MQLIPLQNKKPVLKELNKLAVSSFTCISAFIPSKITPKEYITPSRIKLIHFYKKNFDFEYILILYVYK